jgi:hypothetical protein
MEREMMGARVRAFYVDWAPWVIGWGALIDIILAVMMVGQFLHSGSINVPMLIVYDAIGLVWLPVFLSHPLWERASASNEPGT